MLLTGAHVPIMRSFAMAVLFTLARARRAPRAFAARAGAGDGGADAGWRPARCWASRFQMSFSAVLALIAGYEALRPWLARLWTATARGGGAGRPCGGAGADQRAGGHRLGAVRGVPFRPVQVYFVLANMAAVPLTALWVMPAGLIALALMPFTLEALALVPMGWGVGAVLWVARTVAAWPAATVAVPHMPAWGLAVLSLGIAWLGLWRTRLRLARDGVRSRSGWPRRSFGRRPTCWSPPTRG